MMKLHALFLILCGLFASAAFSGKKRWFCKNDEYCRPGQCCKRLFTKGRWYSFGIKCIDYLQEGEPCVFEDVAKLGCGCSPGLDCVQTGTLRWSCQKEPQSDVIFNRYF